MAEGRKKNSSTIAKWYETRKSPYIYPPASAEGLPIPLILSCPNAGQSARAASDLGTNQSDLIIAMNTMSTLSA